MTPRARRGAPPDARTAEPRPTAPRPITSRLAATLLGACLVAAACVLAPGVATAAARPYVSTSSADMFWCTSTQGLCTSQTVTTGIPSGTPLRMVCWRDDRAPFPNASNRWFYSVLDNGQEGYLWAPQVGGQVSTPNCSSVNWVNVSDWVIGRADGNTTRWRSQAQDGPFVPDRAGNYWSGYCLSFVSDAWNMAGGAPTSAFAYPSAIDAWNGYARQGKVDTQHRPPRGALVFWNIGRYGHVAVSLGNWRVVSTQGDAPQTLPIYDYSFSPSSGSYLGWVMPVPASVPQNVG